MLSGMDACQHVSSYAGFNKKESVEVVMKKLKNLMECTTMLAVTVYNLHL